MDKDKKKFYKKFETSAEGRNLKFKISNLFMRFTRFKSVFYFTLGIFFIVFIFRDVLSTQHFLYFTDFLYPASKEFLNSYLENFNILNIKGNLRFNFFSEVITLLNLNIFSNFFNYDLAVKIYFVNLILVIYIFTYIFTYFKTKDPLFSLSIALFSTTNLWIMDRLQQGHLPYYTYFYIPAFLYLYFLLFSKKLKYSFIYLAILFSLALQTYFHYAFILIYTSIIKFIYDTFSFKDFKILKDWIYFGIISALILSPFLLTYYSQLSYFTGLSSNTSPKEVIEVFATTSRIFSFIYLFRDNLYSSGLLNLNFIYLISFTIFTIAIYYILINKSKEDSLIKLIFIILGFFTFGFFIFKDIYLKLYEFVPLFTTFRDMNKFVGIYLIIITLLLINKYFLITKSNLLSSLIIFSLLFISLSPWFSNKINYFNEFSVVNSEFLYHIPLYKDNTIYNAISIPSYQNFFYKFNNNYFHSYIPIINSYTYIKTIEIPFPYQKDADSIRVNSFFENLYKSRNKEQFLKTLESRNIKYIYFYKNIKFKSNEKEIDKWYKKIKVEELLSENKIYENSELIIYRLNNIKSFISFEKGFFKRINTVKYLVHLENLKDLRKLEFLEDFNMNWKVYLNPVSSTGFNCDVIKEYNNEGNNLKECKHEQKFFEGEELKYLIEKPLFEDSHKVVYDYANQWTIDPEYIKANFDKSYYKQNPDGSIDIELVLYFKPQSYFYLGLIISITTLLVCIIYLIYDSIKRRKKSNPNVINLVRNLN